MGGYHSTTKAQQLPVRVHSSGQHRANMFSQHVGTLHHLATSVVGCWAHEAHVGRHTSSSFAGGIR
jgi:hypothetical protein